MDGRCALWREGRRQGGTAALRRWLALGQGEKSHSSSAAFPPEEAPRAPGAVTDGRTGFWVASESWSSCPYGPVVGPASRGPEGSLLRMGCSFLGPDGHRQCLLPGSSLVPTVEDLT